MHLYFHQFTVTHTFSPPGLGPPSQNLSRKQGRFQVKENNNECPGAKRSCWVVQVHAICWLEEQSTWFFLHKSTRYKDAMFQGIPMKDLNTINKTKVLLKDLKGGIDLSRTPLTSETCR